jgi:glycosyltransferase involved in cell wall biosynthesis
MFALLVRSMGWKQFVHRWLWQNLPTKVRRRTLSAVTAQFAPRPSLNAVAKTPIIIVGFLQTASGLGEGARLCYEALSQCGHDVYGIDLTSAFRQPGPRVPFPFRNGRSFEGPGTLIIHVNGPYLPLALMHLGRRLVIGKRIIGYWAWELPKVPPEWRSGWPFIHEIWVPSQFTADALAKISRLAPITVMPHPVVARTRPTLSGKCRRERRFTALVIFNMASGFSRKNPMAAVEAFRRAFGNDPTCRLIVRVVNGTCYEEGYQRLKAAIGSLGNATLSDADSVGPSTNDLYASADVVVSLHRSEGFGLVIAEAMLHGLPVVATNWSGNVDFFTADNGLPVSYSLVPANDPQGTYDYSDCLWAEPDVDDAAAKLAQLRLDPRLRADLGGRALTEARLRFGVDRYIERIGETLDLRT